MAASFLTRPTPKEIVQWIMPTVCRHEKSLAPQGLDKELKIMNLAYDCMKIGCASPNVYFADKSGFNTPYQHLKRFYDKGQSPDEQEGVLHNLYVTHELR